MKTISILLFIFLYQNVMAHEELTFRINESTTLKGILLNEHEFAAIKAELNTIDSKPFNNSITRKYNQNNKQSVFEFFNGSAILFDKIVQKEELKNIEFSRILFSSQKNEITYSIHIENDFYQLLQSEIESKIDIDELTFFGEFYTLKNGNVIVKWSDGFRPSKYSILKNIRAMASIDPEFPFSDETDQLGSPIEWEEIIENTKYEPVKFGTETNSSHDDIRKRISALLNFEKSMLDYSLESINLLENSMIWNCDNISKYELLDLCYPYIGEVASRAFNLNWIKEKDSMILVDDNFNKTDFEFNLQRGITQGDYIPTVKWVIEQLEVDLKQK